MFPTEWFTPCILVYTQEDFADSFDTNSMSYLSLQIHRQLHLNLSLSLLPASSSLPPSSPLSLVASKLDRSVLLTETKGIRPVQSPATFTPLSLAETPQPGDLAAIDAKFVTLNQVKIKLQWNKININEEYLHISSCLRIKRFQCIITAAVHGSKSFTFYGSVSSIQALYFPMQEEAEVKSDGTHTTLKPSQYSVARITVIRG